ncbi:PREDICTED: THO complex subunit 2 isoform X2 [Brassica oleracea var. oleracea]|uniref:THO complex subunit 2 isoform X2 n=1 Tax=Brassica oleracea var. oleracea TaxID=109376 RepID=UPI0006A73606|nr:PREDICTED: THO complex subunit 2 isoform X2 [Brassica oleracea var. oleracea]
MLRFLYELCWILVRGELPIQSCKAVLEKLTMSGDHRSRLTKLGKCPSKDFPRVLREFLWEAEMVKIKAQDLKGKEVRLNTRLLYQQTKFNLLREKSEGYAKLATLLCRGSASSSDNASPATMRIIKVLDCFEIERDYDMLLNVIPVFPKSHAPQILGFKFQYYQRLELNCPVPSGLYKLSALLVKEDFINLESM